MKPALQKQITDIVLRQISLQLGSAAAQLTYDLVDADVAINDNVHLRSDSRVAGEAVCRYELISQEDPGLRVLVAVKSGTVHSADVMINDPHSASTAYGQRSTWLIDIRLPRSLIANYSQCPKVDESEDIQPYISLEEDEMLLSEDGHGLLYK